MQEDASYFEDTDQLGALMTDTRAQDVRTVSNTSDARDIIEAFRGDAADRLV